MGTRKYKKPRKSILKKKSLGKKKRSLKKRGRSLKKQKGGVLEVPEESENHYYNKLVKSYDETVGSPENLDPDLEVFLRKNLKFLNKNPISCDQRKDLSSLQYISAKMKSIINRETTPRLHNCDIQKVRFYKDKLCYFCETFLHLLAPKIIKIKDTATRQSYIREKFALLKTILRNFKEKIVHYGNFVENKVELLAIDLIFGNEKVYFIKPCIDNGEESFIKVISISKISEEIKDFKNVIGNYFINFFGEKPLPEGDMEKIKRHIDTFNANKSKGWTIYNKEKPALNAARLEDDFAAKEKAARVAAEKKKADEKEPLLFFPDIYREES